MKLGYDKRNNQIYCTNAYACKDTLKAMGFKWNGMGKIWFVWCPESIEELSVIIRDVFINCNMDYDDLYDFLDEKLPYATAEKVANYLVNDAKFQEATADI